VLLLLLSPAFGMQYLSWAVAAAYLVSTRAATGYNLAASVMVIVVYIRWNGAYPWNWWEAGGQRFLAREFALMVVVWLALAVVAGAGLRYLGRPASSDRARVEARVPPARWGTG
jgi:hypothetical protein